MQDVAHEVVKFIDLNYANILYLFAVGFVGGLVSGFIGSGGAFVLTPGMMSLGVPGLVAVASNMCHKFPKALVGALKRAKYGQVDVKLGIIFGIFAEAGVFYGATIQESIKKAFGDAGSNLYVSVSFVVILAVVGGFVLRDALKTYRSGKADEEEKVSKIAKWVQSINIPGTMVYFKCLKARVSVLFIIPLAFVTGYVCCDYRSGRFYRCAFIDLCTWSSKSYGFCHGTGRGICHGTGRFIQIRIARIGGFSLNRDYSGRFSLWYSTGSYGYHLCEAVHDKVCNGRYHGNRSFQQGVDDTRYTLHSWG